MIKLLTMLGTEQVCISVMCLIAGFGLVLNSLEYITERETFAPAGLLDWNVCRLGRRCSSFGLSGRLLDRVFSQRGFWVLLLLRMAFAVGLCLFAGTTSVAMACSCAILLLSLCMNLRHTFGRDGSDQMLVIVFAGLSLYFALSERVRGYALLFVALEVTLSYLVAGYVKLISPMWLRGDAIIGILGTRCYGVPKELRTLVIPYLPRVARALCWSVILFECTFPALWFAPKPVALGFLVAGIGFHAGIAILMGLNIFFWAFLAAYPAVCYCYMNFSPMARM